MKTGIYKLTFPGGASYIGKAVNIDKRWEQHSRSMNNGTSAKPLQNEYNAYGEFPIGTILTECHREHLDVLEDHFISSYKPILNTVIPEYSDSYILEDLPKWALDYLGKSTAEILLTMEHLAVASDAKNTSISDLEDENASLSINLISAESRVDALVREFGVPIGWEPPIDQEKVELKENLKHAIDDIIYFRDKVKSYEDYFSLPWWKRLFTSMK